MILALETSGPTTNIHLLYTDGSILSTKVWDSGRQLADELLGVLHETFAAAGLDLMSVEGLIIYSGPGSFTSLRIGHTVVNALATHLGISVVGTRGDNWLQEGVSALPSTKKGVIAMPFYGAEANITRPKG